MTGVSLTRPSDATSPEWPDSNEAVLADSRQDRELPFVPTLLCLWAAGWVTSVLTSLLFLGRTYPNGGSPTLIVAVNLILSAAVGAVVVRQLLLSVVGCDLSYSGILLALVAGSVASTVVRLIVFSQIRSGSAVLPVAGLGLSLVPALAGALVSYWVLQNAAQAEAPAAAPIAPRTEPQRAASREARRPANPYNEVVAAARETTLGLVAAVNAAEPSSVPSVISNGMLGLEAVRRRIGQTPAPENVPAELTQRLAAGMTQLGDDLALAAQEAATTAADRMYEPGLLDPSLADVSDHGGRYRWELEQSKGLRAVKQALEELYGLGYGRSWD